MTKQEVWVKEMPKSPDECPCNYDTFCNLLDEGENCWFEIRKDCPLHDIHDHDRELVKKVCEKIKDKALDFWYFVLNEQKEHFNNNRYVISRHDLYNILDQIAKEFEDER